MVKIGPVTAEILSTLSLSVVVVVVVNSHFRVKPNGYVGLWLGWGFDNKNYKNLYLNFHRWEVTRGLKFGTQT